MLYVYTHYIPTLVSPPLLIVSPLYFPSPPDPLLHFPLKKRQSLQRYQPNIP